MKALLSVWDKNSKVASFACGLVATGYELVGSSGTKKYLETQGLTVTDTSMFTGLKPVLDHRVATLCPQIHGGLLANLEELRHVEELARLGWPTIEMVVVTFYPLQEKMRNPDLTPDQINESVDIGGPTLVSSACKGDRIVVTDEADFGWVLAVLKDKNRIRGGLSFPSHALAWLHAVAAATVAEYRATEARFRIRKLRSSIVWY